MTLRERRLAVKTTLKELAAQVGVNPSYLSLVENGKRVPREWVWQRLAQALDCGVEEIKPGDDDVAG